jgi:hypothetical protein
MDIGKGLNQRLYANLDCTTFDVPLKRWGNRALFIGLSRMGVLRFIQWMFQVKNADCIRRTMMELA